MLNLFSILMMVCPYAYFAGIAFFVAFDMDSDELLLGFFLIYSIAAIVAAVCYCVAAKGKPLGSAFRNLLGKLVVIPGDLAVVAFVTVRSIENARAAAEGAMGVGLSVFVMILFLIPYLIARISAILAQFAVCRRVVSGSNGRPKRYWHVALHLLPVADVVSAFAVYWKLHRGDYAGGS